MKEYPIFYLLIYVTFRSQGKQIVLASSFETESPKKEGENGSPLKEDFFCTLEISSLRDKVSQPF